MHRGGGFAGPSAACAGPLSSAPRAGRRTHRRRMLAATFRAKFANSIALIRCPSSLARCWLGGKASVCWGAKGGGSNNGLVSRACCASARSAAEELFDELFQAARRNRYLPVHALDDDCFAPLQHAEGFRRRGGCGRGFLELPHGNRRFAPRLLQSSVSSRARAPRPSGGAPLCFSRRRRM